MTGCAASAIATHTPNPTGAPGSAQCQPAPVPRVNAITTTPPSASSLAAVTTFCTHRPDATPTRLMPVNSATSPAPSGAMSAGGQASRRTRNSPAATPIAAIATPLVPRASTQPTTKPARVPNASRTKRSEEHTSELQSRLHLVCRLLLEKKKNKHKTSYTHNSHDKHR